MRVVIEFVGAGQWSGMLHAEDGPTVDAPFAGRLDLLRLLEALVEPALHLQHEGHQAGPREQR